MYKQNGTVKESGGLVLDTNKTCKLNFDARTFCCGKTVQKLHFVFKDETLNRKEIVESFKRKIEGQNVTIFGDSLQRHFHQWMAEVVGIGSKIYQEAKTVRYDNGQKYTQIWYLLKHNSNVSFKCFGFFGLERLCGHKIELWNLHRDMFLKALEISDIIIINFGLHYGPCNTTQFKETSEMAANILTEHISKHPHKQAIFRNTLPQHFKNTNKSEDGYFQEFNVS